MWELKKLNIIAFTLAKNDNMKNSFKITVALATIGAAAITLYVIRRINSRQMMIKVSNEGYETAQDILFPGKKIAETKLHYGPVVPM